MLIAEVDPDNTVTEWKEDNNSFEAGYIGGEPQVDVAVTGIALSPESVPEGGSFNASITVRNTGTETADAGYLQIFFDGNPVGRETRVSRMNAGAEKTIRVSRVPVIGLAGEHMVTAVVDCRETLVEINEDNNTDETFLTLTEAPKPDFVIHSFNIIPEAPVAGRSFSAEIVIGNEGDLSGNPGYVKVYHEDDEANAQMFRLSSIKADQQRVLKINGKFTALQGYAMLIAEVDPTNTVIEWHEDNNSFESEYIGGEPQVDVAVTDITLSPESVPEGGSFNASITVRNTGTETADAGYLQIFFDGNPVGRETRVSRMNAGAEKTIHVSSLPAAALAGDHMVTAMVDCRETLVEINEDNNYLDTQLTLIEGPKPDLTITAIELDPAFPGPGERFSATVWVQNVGEANSDGAYVDIWVNNDSLYSDGYIQLSTVRAKGAPVKVTINNLYAPDDLEGQFIYAFIDLDEQIIEEDESNNDFEMDYTNPLTTYYPLIDGAVKWYTHDASIITELNPYLSSATQKVYSEYKTVEGYENIAYMGYKDGNIVSFGVESEGEDLIFSKPMLLATAEQMMYGGSAQGTTSLTLEVDGQRITVTIATESTVNIVNGVVTPMGTFNDCRELTYEARVIIYGQDYGVLLSNAAYYAPGIGPVKMKVMEADQYGNLSFRYYIELTDLNFEPSE